jgi:hypothetical protein
MLRAADFVLIQAQAVIFTPGLNLSTTRVLASILDAYADNFNGDPITLPAPPANFLSSADSPRLLLQSQNGLLKLQVAPSRTDVLQAGDNLDATRPLPVFLDWCCGLFDDYLAVTQGRVGRLACVVQRRAITPNAPREIATHFCQPHFLTGPLNRPSDFEIHAAKQFAFIEGLPINSWFRCKSGSLTLPGEQPQVAVIVEQDFNTLPEQAEKQNFTAEQRRQFFSRVPAELQLVMNRYFPQTEA